MKSALAALLLAACVLLALGQEAFWEPAEPSSTPQEGATCDFVDGKLVVFGGRTSFKTWVSHSLRFYENGAWREVVLEGDVDLVRSFHTAVPHQGKLYIFGGRTGLFTVSNDLIVVDPKGPSAKLVTGTVGPVPAARQAHAAAIIGAKMYVHGGSAESQLHTALDDLSVYDIEKNTWEALGSGGGRRMGHRLVAYKDLLYAFGGSEAGSSYNVREVAVYDTAKKQWRVAAAQLEPRCGHSATLVDGKVWLIAGRNQKEMLGDAVVWNLQEDRPEAAPVHGRLDPPRQGHCAAYAPADGSPILVFGGSQSYSQYYKDLQRLYTRPTTMQLVRWRRQASEPKAAQPQAGKVGLKEGGALFAERAKKIWAKLQTATQEELVKDSDISDLQQKLAELISRPTLARPADTIGSIKIQCQDFEASVKGEEDTRLRLVEETTTLKETQLRAARVFSQHETNEAELERLAKDAKDWEGKLETLSQQVKAAEVQYESYDQKKEHLKEDIRRSESQRLSLQEQLEGKRKELRLAQASFYSLESRYNASKLKKDEQVTELADLQAQIDRKQAEIADVKQKLQEAEAEEIDLDSKRMDAANDMHTDKTQIDRIQKLLQEQNSLTPKIKEAQRAQRSAQELTQGWITRVKAIAEPADPIENEEAFECTGAAPCGAVLDAYIKQLQDLLAQHQKRMKEKEEAKAQIETRIREVVKRRDALQQQLNALEATLQDLQRRLRYVRSDQDYESRNWPKVLQEWTDAKKETEKVEKAIAELEELLGLAQASVADLRQLLQQEEKAFGSYADTHQRLTKERHAAALKYEHALETLEGKIDDIDKTRKDRRDLRRHMGDVVRDWESTYTLHQKHTTDLDALRQQLSHASSSCDRLLLSKDAEMTQLKKEKEELEKNVAALTRKLADYESLKTAAHTQQLKLDAAMKENVRLRDELAKTGQSQ